MNLFVPYEIAKSLKDKGFDVPCFAKYFEMDKNSDVKELVSNNPNHLYNFNEMLMDENDPNSNIMISAPIYDSVIDWFQSKNIFIETQLDQTSGVKFSYEITSIIDNEFKRSTNIESWSLYYDKHKALDQAIIESINLI